MSKGIIKWFNEDKGYGFIEQKEGGNDSEEDFKLKWDSGEIEVGNVRELREFKEKLLTLKK